MQTLFSSQIWFEAAWMSGDELALTFGGRHEPWIAELSHRYSPRYEKMVLHISHLGYPFQT
jgi:hypothetical protein